MKCYNCNSTLPDNSEFCPYCGNRIDSNPIQEKPARKEKKGKKITTIVISVISTVLAISIGKFIGGYFTELSFDGYSERKIEKELAEFKENFEENYIPGTMYGSRYVSEYFELVFDFDESWELMSEEELMKYTSDAREGGISGAIGSIEGEDISEELKEKLMMEYLNSFYVETETGASYYEDGIPVANVAVLVMSVYGMDQVSFSDTMEEAVAGYEDNFGHVTERTELIGDEIYHVIEARTEVSGIGAVLRQYIREEKGVFCIVQYVGVEGYDDEAEESFLEMFNN